MSPLALQPLHSVAASVAAQGHTGVEEGPSMWSVLPPQPVWTVVFHVDSVSGEQQTVSGHSL